MSKLSSKLMNDIFGNMPLLISIFTYLQSIDILSFTYIYSKYCCITNREIIKIIYFPLYSEIFTLKYNEIKIGNIDILINYTLNALNAKFQDKLNAKSIPNSVKCKSILINQTESTIRHYLFNIFKPINVDKKYSIYKLLYDNKLFSLLSRFILDGIVANPLECLHSLRDKYGSSHTLIFAVGNRNNNMVIQMLKDVTQQQMFIINHYDLNTCLKLSIETNNHVLFSAIFEYAHKQKLIKNILLKMSQSITIFTNPTTHIFIYSIIRDINNINLNINIWNWESKDGRPFNEQDIIFDDNNNLQLSSDMKEYIDSLYLFIINWVDNNLDTFQYLNTILHYLNINNIPISNILRFYFGQNKYLLTKLINIIQNNIFIIMYLLKKYHIDTDSNIDTFKNYFYGNDSIIDLTEYVINSDPYSIYQFNTIPFTNFVLLSKLIDI
jgi:hypothetical protein